ncbi:MULTISPECIES: Asp23/Gls24 family envelope stress response protein [Loigolactobacillus]|uniref:Alkaline-shock protein n=1 Tax=Loigolactobacillus backii TaxID=375175 RepID=A0A192H484_9LACO|nr:MULTISPECIES: Asp23/Gls24 family envelope stress response protein [Loigolactobacillus]ANK59358.1 alkaline-shock protein [Loigolactobacillus backii]ANK63063.1 alkaline-shock protein [Loigolactobacillus backii]ANK64351.1 alkaline-shock protein [Loigolactobacillus backii]ANK67253.1 alkaline-shock protein [Loigolactobacillus backii]ANK69929.1 alkaline-shock protein [Loigolactobacillus backii]
MAEDNNIVLDSKEQPSLGKIEIAPEVIEIILGIAAREVKGVYQMRGTLASSINALFGRENRGKGVKLSVSDGKIKAEVYVYLNYGVSVPQVALKMQDRIKEQLLFMTDLSLVEVNIHVVGVIPEKLATTVDPNNLFADDDDENGDNK